MHSGAINREYKFKFYLNANHYIIIDGKEGEQHPHTWEFMVHIRMNGQKFVQFDAYEKAIDGVVHARSTCTPLVSTPKCSTRQ